MNDDLHLSSRGANLIRAFESCLAPIGDGRFRAYRCPAGVLTIGWGHTNAHGRQFDANAIWTQGECDAEFERDMEIFERAVRRLVKVPLEQHQFDALVSFAYNVGERAFAASTLLRLINAGNFDDAAHQFHRWRRAGGRIMPGLVRRRASEALLFQGIPDANYDGKPDVLAMPQAVDAPRGDWPLVA